jgi:glycosyltransferase involved in cell wall biosynthesis
MNDQVLEKTSDASTERPLVTFALFAYNQEKYIGEAVQSALAQTYSPLQIIISDDASTDQTFEIVQEMAAAYHGPHVVILNRNETNLGIGAHVNILLGMSRGELFVFAAGDDVSLPERTSILVDNWLESGKPDGSLYSAIQTVSADGSIGQTIGQGASAYEARTISQCVRDGAAGVHGCAHAVTKTIFTNFGPLPSGTVFEDRALAFRSRLSGRVIYIDRVLVNYRLHGGNVSGHQIFREGERFRRAIDATLIQYESFRADYLSYVAPGAPDKNVLRAIRRAEKCTRQSERIVTGNSFERLRAIRAYTVAMPIAARVAFAMQIMGLSEGRLFRMLSWSRKTLLKIINRTPPARRVP